MFISSLSVEHDPSYIWLYLEGVLIIAAVVYMLSFESYRQRLKKGWWIIVGTMAILGATIMWAISSWK